MLLHLSHLSLSLPMDHLELLVYVDKREQVRRLDDALAPSLIRLSFFVLITVRIHPK